VVWVDLFATLVQPAALLYVLYLVFLAFWSPGRNPFPLISLILIGCVYGFQVIIFLLKQEWQHIGWMVIYLIATPVFTFWLPIYSFWHFDDFGWGNTRVVVGEEGKAVHVAEVDVFDPNSVKLKTWTDYENERVDGVHGKGSEFSSSYGRESIDKPMAAMNAYNSGYSGYSGDMSGYSAAESVSLYQSNRKSYASGIPNNRNSYASGIPNNYTSIGGNLSGRRSNMRDSDSNLAVNVLPSDAEILEKVREILRDADLMSVTKKGVREELGRWFGREGVEGRREFVGICIDGVLSGEV
jgi:chitin synthase